MTTPLAAVPGRRWPFHPDLIDRISEDEWKSTVIAAARAHGWLVAHFRPALTSKGWRTAVEGDGAGFPDLVMVRRGPPSRLVIVELKRERGRLSAPQLAWLGLLSAVPGIEVYEWRPRHWAEVERVLKGEDAA